MGEEPPPSVRDRGRIDQGVPGVAGDRPLGAGRSRIDGALGAAQGPERRRVCPGLRAGERGGDLCRGADAQSLANGQAIRRAGQIDRRRSHYERDTCDSAGQRSAWKGKRLQLLSHRRDGAPHADREAGSVRRRGRGLSGRMPTALIKASRAMVGVIRGRAWDFFKIMPAARGAAGQGQVIKT